jgi:hypothetical protein
MEQTAVSWLLDRILEGKCQVVYTKDIGYLFYQTEDIIEQAKEMEKEQIKMAFSDAWIEGKTSDMTSVQFYTLFDGKYKDLKSEEYYIKIYNNGL